MVARQVLASRLGSQILDGFLRACDCIRHGHKLAGDKAGVAGGKERLKERFWIFALRTSFAEALLLSLERKLALARADFAAREGFLALGLFFSLEERLALPAKFRGELGDKVIITRGVDGCLFVYTKGNGRQLRRNGAV
jgi:hypothetical protein